MTTEEQNAAKGFMGFMFILGTIFGPMITIWSVNTLLGIEIPITLSTWFATSWITGIFTSAATMLFMIHMNKETKEV